MRGLDGANLIRALITGRAALARLFGWRGSAGCRCLNAAHTHARRAGVVFLAASSPPPPPPLGVARWRAGGAGSLRASEPRAGSTGSATRPRWRTTEPTAATITRTGRDRRASWRRLPPRRRRRTQRAIAAVTQQAAPDRPLRPAAAATRPPPLARPPAAMSSSAPRGPSSAAAALLSMPLETYLDLTAALTKGHDTVQKVPALEEGYYRTSDLKQVRRPAQGQRPPTPQRAAHTLQPPRQPPLPARPRRSSSSTRSPPPRPRRARWAAGAPPPRPTPAAGARLPRSPPGRGPASAPDPALPPARPQDLLSSLQGLPIFNPLSIPGPDADADHAGEQVGWGGWRAPRPRPAGQGRQAVEARRLLLTRGLSPSQPPLPPLAAQAPATAGASMPVTCADLEALGWASSSPALEAALAPPPGAPGGGGGRCGGVPLSACPAPCGSCRCRRAVDRWCACAPSRRPSMPCPAGRQRRPPCGRRAALPARAQQLRRRPGCPQAGSSRPRSRRLPPSSRALPPPSQQQRRHYQHQHQHQHQRRR